MPTVLIPVPSWGSATLIEVVWATVGAVGAILVTANGASALSLFRSIRRDEGDDAFLTLLARAYLRREAFRLVQTLLILLVGVWAVVLPNPGIGGRVQVTVVGLVLTGALVLIAALVVAQSLLDLRVRVHAERALARQHWREQAKTESVTVLRGLLEEQAAAKHKAISDAAAYRLKWEAAEARLKQLEK